MFTNYSCFTYLLVITGTYEVVPVWFHPKTGDFMNPKIYFIRNQYVMLDKDVAEFYNINTKDLNKAMRRKIKFFEDNVFQLTKDEYESILELNNEKRTSKYLPMVYSEIGAYQMAMALDSNTGLKVSKLILDVFMAYKQGLLAPVQKDNRVLQIENRLSKVETELKGFQAIQYNFHAPVTNFVQGSMTQNIQSKDDFVLEIAKLMVDSQVNQNKEVMNLLTQTIVKANSSDKKGVLDNLKSILEIGTSVSSLVTGIPNLINVIGKIFS